MWVRARFPLNVAAKRLFVRKFAERYRAFDEPLWSDEPLISLFAIDAAYGAVGGDRCVGVHFKFGRCVDGVSRLAIREGPLIIPVSVGEPLLPEHQIVAWVRDYCVRHDIHPSNVGLDSTGRGSLVSAFAKEWSPLVEAIEFGGSPSERQDPMHALKTAKDGYFNMASELAFAVRACIEADQFRGLTLDVALEAEMRAWSTEGKGAKYKIETKDETRERIKRSPDLLDGVVVGVELARRRGFVIAGGRPSYGKSAPLARAREAARSWTEANAAKGLSYT
jgi:hypothetical protein